MSFEQDDAEYFAPLALIPGVSSVLAAQSSKVLYRSGPIFEPLEPSSLADLLSNLTEIHRSSSSATPAPSSTALRVPPSFTYQVTSVSPSRVVLVGPYRSSLLWLHSSRFDDLVLLVATEHPHIPQTVHVAVERQLGAMGVL
jgi:hypothetical protein